MWPTPIAAVLMVRANQFWFVALLVSISMGIMEIWNWSGDAKIDASSEGKGEGTKSLLPQSEELAWNRSRRKLTVDFFDLLIPGHVTGWIPSSLSTIGFASALSTLLASKEIWDKL